MDHRYICEFWCRFRIVPVLMFGSWVLNEIWIIDLSSTLVSMLMSSFNYFLSNEAHLNSGVKVLLELCCVIIIKHIGFFSICMKLIMEFTITSLPLNFCTSVSGYGCGFGYEENHRWIDGFVEKRHRSLNLPTLIHPLHKDTTPLILKS